MDLNFQFGKQEEEDDWVDIDERLDDQYIELDERLQMLREMETQMPYRM